MRASTDRRRGTFASARWHRARCATSSTSRRSNHTKCATIWSAAIRNSNARWRRFLCVYRAVKLIKETAAAAQQEPSDAVAIISYDEKPGIQAIATTAPDLPPEPGVHEAFARD